MYTRSVHQMLVDQFMLRAGQSVPIAANVGHGTAEVRKLRAKLIFEEAMETIEALGVKLHVTSKDGVVELAIDPECVRFEVTDAWDFIEVVDGCCDIKVVTTGTLSALGVGDLAVQMAVDKNNLDKFGPGGYRRDDGKWVKPPGHKKPDLRQNITWE